MPANPALLPLDSLPRTPASDVKKLGWRGVMRTVARSGQMLVTNHDQPEAVILPVEEYNRLLALLREAAQRDEAILDDLRQDYSERLKVLQSPEARATLCNLLRKPLKLEGQVIAGDGF